MATVVQNIDYDATVFPYRQDIPFQANDGFQGAVPWGQAIVDETFTLDAVGVGDVGSANIGINLPNNYCAMLRSVHLNQNSAPGGLWNTGVLGLAYQQPGGPYKNSMTALPESDYLFWPLISTQLAAIAMDGATLNLKNWVIGTHGASDLEHLQQGADNPMNVPLWVAPGYPGHTALIILNSLPYASAVPSRINMTFDLYTFEAANAAGVMSSTRTTST
jgi:hypothetical protein